MGQQKKQATSKAKTAPARSAAVSTQQPVAREGTTHPALMLQQAVGNHATQKLLRSEASQSDGRLDIQRQTREDGLSTIEAGAQAVQKPDIETVATFLSEILSYWLSNAKFVQWLQNQYQLPGPTGSIKARPMEIYENIGERKSIETTAKRGSKALGALAAIPTFFELANAAKSMGAGEFEEAQRIFAKAAGVPGIEQLLNAAINSVFFDQAADPKGIATGRDSLITVVTAGLPDTINLISALIYSFGDTPIPEESQFRMDPSVLDKLYKYIPEEVDKIYYKLGRVFD